MQSIEEPYTEFNDQLIFDILQKAYWPIHGEMKVLESINERRCNNDSSNSTGTPCFDKPRFVISHILLMLHMIVTSILLLNLLIAMFA